MRTISVLAITLLMVSSLPMGLAAQEEEEGVVPDSYEFDELYHDFMTYSDIQAQLTKINLEHPDITEIYDMTARTEFGTTYEGRSIWAIKISDNPSRFETDEEKVIILGSVHAREWMGYETAMYFIHYLTSLYGQPPTDNDGDGQINEDPIDNVDNDGDGQKDEDGSEAKVTWLVDNREIYVMPFPNPDGTEYDRWRMENEGSSWRKNMRDNNGDNEFDPEWDGVDLNRNFPYMWAANRYGRIVDENGVTITADSSNPRSGQYHGPEDNHDDDGDSRFPAPDWWNQHYMGDWNGIDEDPYDGRDNDGDGKVDEDKEGGFSEPETRAIEELFNMLDSDGDHTNGHSDVAIYLDYHTVIGMILYPWGWTQDLAPHDDLLVDIAMRMAEIDGYDVVKGTDLYPTSGDSLDWVYASMGSLAYTIEIAPIGGGGFHPEAKYIINQTRENLGVNLLLVEIAELARAAKEGDYPSIDIGVPLINHTQTVEELGPYDEYQVKASIDNWAMMAPDSLFVVYRGIHDDGSAGQWKRLPMKALKKEGRYEAYIQRYIDGTTVEYYIEAKDLRGPTVASPQYAHAEPYTYMVTLKIGLANVDMAALILSMIIFYGIIWGGFIRATSFAVRAEKRKARMR